MQRLRDVRRTHKKSWFGMWILMLAALLGAAGWGFGVTEPIRAQVLGATVKSTPAPAITSGPSGPVSSTSATFKYSDNEKGVTFLCALNDASLASCPASGMTYNGLSEGSYTFRVAAQGVSLSPTTSRSWTVDLQAPAPTITDKPENPTIETAAPFTFSASEPGVTFQCSLDGAKAAACTSPLTYNKVAIGDHTFSVVAIDRAGNRSPAATWVWTVLINKTFGISGNAHGSLSPGMAGTPLDLTFTNPYNFAISVERVDVTIHSSSSNACPISGNFKDTTKRFDLALPVVVPANASVTPPAGSRPGNWPTVAMENTPVNQDACKNVTFTLSYTGTARKS